MYLRSERLNIIYVRFSENLKPGSAFLLSSPRTRVSESGFIWIAHYLTPLYRIPTHAPRKGRCSSSRKRPSNQTDSPLPLSKRPCSVSLTKPARGMPNRLHRRVILWDYRKFIYEASSRSALLAALEGLY